MVSKKIAGNLHKAVMEYSKTHKRGFEYQLEKKLDAFERKDFFPHDCTCYGSQLVIQPDGQISNCPFFKTGFGHVNEVNDNFRIWNQPLVKEWRKRLPLYHQEFKNNDAKAMCGAGCAWSSKELHGDLSVDQSSRIFQRRCSMNSSGQSSNCSDGILGIIGGTGMETFPELKEIRGTAVDKIRYTFRRYNCL